VLAVTVSACVTTYQPLKDYEEMIAPKIMEAPTLEPGVVEVLEQVAPGEKATELFVNFGVYRSRDLRSVTARP
jgi:hypothetical protein